MDHEHDAFVTGRQARKQIEELFPWPIFSVEKPHAFGELFTGDDLGVRVDPGTGHVPSRVALGDLDGGGLPDALCLAGIPGGIDVEFRRARTGSLVWVGREPDRSVDALAAFTVGLEVEVLLAVECGQFRRGVRHRIALFFGLSPGRGWDLRPPCAALAR
jgi:hypothetical protein